MNWPRVLVIGTVCLVCGLMNIHAQTNSISEIGTSYNLTNNDGIRQSLKQAYPRSLSDHFQNINEAFSLWNDFENQFITFLASQKSSFEGGKIWVEIYWNADGNIEHVGYFSQKKLTRSKDEELSDLFTSFVDEYDPVEPFGEQIFHFGIIYIPKDVGNHTASNSKAAKL